MVFRLCPRPRRGLATSGISSTNDIRNSNSWKSWTHNVSLSHGVPRQGDCKTYGRGRSPVLHLPTWSWRFSFMETLKTETSLWDLGRVFKFGGCCVLKLIRCLKFLRKTIMTKTGSDMNLYRTLIWYDIQQETTVDYSRDQRQNTSLLKCFFRLFRLTLLQKISRFQHVGDLRFSHGLVSLSLTTDFFVMVKSF